MERRSLHVYALVSVNFVGGEVKDSTFYTCDYRMVIESNDYILDWIVGAIGDCQQIRVNFV